MICVNWLRGAEEARLPRGREGSISLDGQPSSNPGTQTSSALHILLDRHLTRRLTPAAATGHPKALRGSHRSRSPETLLPSQASHPQPRSVTFQPPDSGRTGRGAGRRCRRRSALEAAPGSTRPGRSRHVTGAARSPSRACPRDPPAMGDEDEDEGCAVELQITEGGCRIPRRPPGTGGKSQRPAGLIRPPVPAANLTGHEEKVSVENFALLKVLGTGGEKPRSLG